MIAVYAIVGGNVAAMVIQGVAWLLGYDLVTVKE